MSRLDTLVARHPLATWRSVAWPLMLLLAALMIWAGFAQLDQVAVATGEVVPQGKIKVVQHLEGGRSTSRKDRWSASAIPWSG